MADALGPARGRRSTCRRPLGQRSDGPGPRVIPRPAPGGNRPPRRGGARLPDGVDPQPSRVGQAPAQRAHRGRPPRVAEILRTKADRRAARPEAGGEVGFTDLASAYDRARGARRPVRGGGPGRAGLELERRVARALASLRRMAQETAVFAGRGTGGGVGVPFATAPAVDGVDEILGIVVRSSADDPIGGVTGSLEPVGAAADARWRLDLAPERLRGASRPERERRSPRGPRSVAPAAPPASRRRRVAGDHGGRRTRRRLGPRRLRLVPGCRRRRGAGAGVAQHSAHPVARARRSRYR